MARWHWGIGVGVGPFWAARSVRKGRCSSELPLALPMAVGVVYIGVHLFQWWFIMFGLLLFLGVSGILRKASKRIRKFP